MSISPNMGGNGSGQQPTFITIGNGNMNSNGNGNGNGNNKATISAQVTSVNTANNCTYTPDILDNNNNINNMINSNNNNNNNNSNSSINAIANVLQLIFDKVRTLCKQCNLSNLPTKLSIHDILTSINHTNTPSSTSTSTITQYQTAITEYTQILDQIRTKIYIYNELEQEYRKLEIMLQKIQTQNRKHFAVQQQFKLYVDTLKLQYEDSENERIELLENSKVMIKQLKLENQRLYGEIREIREGKEGKEGRGGFMKNGEIYYKEPEKFMQYHLKDSKSKDKVREKERTNQLKSKQQSIKIIPNIKIKSKQRLKSQYCSSLNINQHRTLTQATFITPGKQKFRITQNRERGDLVTQRQQNSKKRKLGEVKKRQNYTVMAYMSHKKKQSKQKDKQKDKGNVKKTLISFSDKRPMDFGDGKNKQNSDKKVNRSILSLQSIDYNQQ